MVGTNRVVVKIFRNLFCVYLFASYVAFYSECGSCCLCCKRNGVGGGSINGGGSIGSKKYEEEGGPKKVPVKNESNVEPNVDPKKVSVEDKLKPEPMAGSKVDPKADPKKLELKKPEIMKPEQKKLEPKKLEPKKEEPKKVGPKKDDKKGGPKKDDKKIEPKKEEPKKVEPKNADFRVLYKKFIDGKSKEIADLTKDVKINEGDSYFSHSNSLGGVISIYEYEGRDKSSNVSFDIKNSMSKPFPKDARVVTRCVYPDEIDNNFKYELKEISNCDIALLPPGGSKKLMFRFENIVNLPCNFQGKGGMGAIYDDYVAYFYIIGDGKKLKGVYSENPEVGSSASEVFIVKLKLSKRENELEKNSDKINEFRQMYDLGKDDFSDEKLFEVLKSSDFDFDTAFSELF